MSGHVTSLEPLKLVEGDVSGLEREVFATSLVAGETEEARTTRRPPTIAKGSRLRMKLKCWTAECQTRKLQGPQ